MSSNSALILVILVKHFSQSANMFRHVVIRDVLLNGPDIRSFTCPNEHMKRDEHCCVYMTSPHVRHPARESCILRFASPACGSSFLLTLMGSRPAKRNFIIRPGRWGLFRSASCLVRHSFGALGFFRAPLVGLIADFVRAVE